MNNSLGKTIKDLRLKQNLTQNQLANKIKISRVALGQYERGQRQPSAKIAMDLAKALNVPIGELFKNDFNQLSTQLEENQSKINSSLIELNKSNPQILFCTIIEYMENTRGFKTPLEFGFLDDITEEDTKENNTLITTDKINEIIDKMCEFMEFEIHKLEKQKLSNIE
ncbi:helix-turn-helix domain-containing protein [Clostridium perfringens]|uniref:helix-turn-helix domain-containing protein n=1 Tax=Clostridium perfringens TaxID=1502 RepID=UPI0024699724|nr:helix-turn-helix domain-containing protein [Clostridium perfringens]MDH5085208.1 hypothetical protein [Clostridium perfringens]